MINVGPFQRTKDKSRVLFNPECHDSFVKALPMQALGTENAREYVLTCPLLNKTKN